MTAASAAWSTSVTKSFVDLALTCSRSRSSEARLMIAPAARAALTAMLSMGCSACDMALGLFEGGHAPEGGPPQRGCKMNSRNFSGRAR